MNVCARFIVAPLLWSASVAMLAAQSGMRAITIDQAVSEAVDRNLGLLAERTNLTVAQAGLVTANNARPVDSPSRRKPPRRWKRRAKTSSALW